MKDALLRRLCVCALAMAGCTTWQPGSPRERVRLPDASIQLHPEPVYRVGNAGEDARVDAGELPSYPLRALLTEINATMEGQCDLIEFTVLKTGILGEGVRGGDGKLLGLEVWTRGERIKEIPETDITEGTIMVIHLNQSECGFVGDESEPMQYPSSTHPAYFDGAIDMFSDHKGLVATDNVLTLVQVEEGIIDAALLSSKEEGSAASSSEKRGEDVATAEQWFGIDGKIPKEGYVDDWFHAHAVPGLSKTSRSAKGLSIQRRGLGDSNTKEDWFSAPSSWGVIEHLTDP